MTVTEDNLTEIERFSNNKARDCPEKLMIETFFSATSIVWLPPNEFMDIQSPCLNKPIAFIRFEGQSLALAFLTSAQFRSK